MPKICNNHSLKEQEKEQEKKYIEYKLDNIKQNNIQKNDSKTQSEIHKNENSSNNITTLKKSNSTTVPLEFYALGKDYKDNRNLTKINFIPSNNGFKSTSNDILLRNYLSIHNHKFDEIQKKLFKSKSTIFEQNVSENNYLNPINIFETRQKSDLPNEVLNKETYNIAKEKLYARDIISQIKKGRNISSKDFISQKRNLIKNNNNNTRYESFDEEQKKNNNNINNSAYFTPKNPTDTSKLKLANNKFNFANHFYYKSMPKNNYKGQKIFSKITENSEQAPEWFKIMPDWKRQQLNNFYEKNEDALNILSKHQKWITVSTRSKSRKLPLEKVSSTIDKNHNILIPKWMIIKHDNVPKDIFKSVQFTPFSSKNKKMRALVDKNLNLTKSQIMKNNGVDESRSIFSFQDFRNNVITKKEREFYDSKVSQVPKQFFCWDDGKKFNPKLKKDV